MKVILFEVFGYPIRSYGLVVALAAILAIGIAYFLARGTKYQKHILDVSMVSIISGIIVARIWHVFFFQWSYYSSNLHEIFAIWNGGISILGGVVGGFTAGAVYAWYHKLDFLEFADIVAPAVIFGQGVGRIACLLNGDAYGSPTGSNFGLVFPEGTMAYNEYGSQPLWPAEVWEGQWDFVVFGLLILMKNRVLPKGFIFFAYIALYSLGRFMLEFLRGDSPRFLLDWTAGQWTTMPFIILSLLMMVFLFVKSKKEANLNI